MIWFNISLTNLGLRLEIEENRFFVGLTIERFWPIRAGVGGHVGARFSRLSPRVCFCPKSWDPMALTFHSLTLSNLEKNTVKNTVTLKINQLSMQNSDSVNGAYCLHLKRFGNN